MKNRFIKYFIAAIIGACFLSSTLMAGSLTYNNQRKVIKAGVLSFTRNSIEYMPKSTLMFYVMDQRMDLKPAGWEFVNPFAFSNDKKASAYWKVSISTPIDELSQMDVLYLAYPQGCPSPFRFSTEEREKLRKFVDSGGTLWIERGVGDIDFSTFFISAIEFKDGGTGPFTSTSNSHPLVARPFQLSWMDITRLGIRNPSIVTDGSNKPPAAKYFSTIVKDNSDKAIISGAQYGSGHIVLAGADISLGIVRTNTPILMTAHTEDLKMAYNIVNWGSEYTTVRKDPRHTGYSFAEVGAPLSILWEYKDTNTSANPNYTSPVILDDMVFYVDMGGVLHAFDLSMSRDRDLNGSTDDGIAEQIAGVPYDELWRANVGVGAGLTAAYVPWDSDAIPAVAAVNPDGSVLGFDARIDENHSPLQLFRANPLASFNDNNIPSLVYSDGGLFVAGGDGALHGLTDFDLGAMSDWVAPKGPITTMGDLTGSPTVGYVYDRITGTVEQLVYVPRKSIATTPGGIQVYPMRVFNDMLTSESSGTGWVPLMSRRSIGCSIKNNSWRVYIPNGSSYDELPSAAVRLSAQPGTFEVNMDAVADAGYLGRPIIADYETDPKSTNFNPRSTITIKANSNIGGEQPSVVGTPALDRDDILHFGTDNGSIYAAQESANPDPRRGASIRTEVVWRSALTDLQFPDLIGNFERFVGSPSVGDGMAYYVVETDKGSYIMAYESSPITEISLRTPIQMGTTVEFIQDDSMNPTSESMKVIYNPNNRGDNNWVDVNYASGKISFRNLRPGMPNQEFSTTQNITIAYIKSNYAGGDGQTREIETHYAFPHTNAETNMWYHERDRWNNLVWCVKLPAAATSSPMLYGTKLFVGLENGNLASVDVNKMEDAVSRLDPGAGNTETTVANNLGVLLKWYEKSGYMHQIPVSTGPPSPIYAAAAGSNGILAVATKNGLSVLYNAVTLVADGNRIVEIDSGGNVVWSCDAANTFADTAISGTMDSLLSINAVPFNRPAVARRTDIGGIVVADTGNNRIVLIDSGGNTIKEVRGFIDPKGIMPVGMPLTISNPQDVTAWMQWNDETDMPEYHFLIADTGNFRVIDVVQVWNEATQTFVNVLNWISSSTLEGKQYSYTSARVMPDPANWNEWMVMAIVSNKQAAQEGMESPGGALIKMSYNPSAAYGRGVMIGAPYTRLPIDIASPASTYNLLNPSFYNRVYKNAATYTDIVIDAIGIHVVEYSESGQSIRHYNNSQYQQDANRPLSASYAQILPNGNILVTNKSLNSYNVGEVFELKWDDMLDKYVIAWPTNLNMQFGSNSFGLRQPSSAERQAF